jgi:uncharacterized protein
VKDPAEVVAVQQKVEATVLEVDVNRKRISLSMKTDSFAAAGSPEASPDTESQKKNSQAWKKSSPCW